MDGMYYFRLWTQGSWCYEQLWIMVVMIDSWMWAEDSRYYEQLSVVVDMNEFRSSAQGFRFYEHLKVVNDISYSGSELKALDAIYSSG